MNVRAVGHRIQMRSRCRWRYFDFRPGRVIRPEDRIWELKFTGECIGVRKGYRNVGAINNPPSGCRAIKGRHID